MKKLAFCLYMQYSSLKYYKKGWLTLLPGAVGVSLLPVLPTLPRLLGITK
jgi:hypothetical protein